MPEILKVKNNNNNDGLFTQYSTLVFPNKVSELIPAPFV